MTGDVRKSPEQLDLLIKVLEHNAVKWRVILLLNLLKHDAELIGYRLKGIRRQKNVLIF